MAREPNQQLFLRDCQTGEEFHIGKNKEVIIGGANNCDVIISDPYASASHCTLQPTHNSGWLLRDHGSKNGTCINGTRVQVAELRPGSQIAIGDTYLEFVATREQGRVRDLLIGNAPVFLAAMDKAQRAARAGCSVLILGETGTGKELVARYIHESSRRAEQPYVAVNCGAMSQELIRSELFGHLKGSFTGAMVDHEGHFRRANLGTIFLDELGELPLNQQPQLLRALETGLIRRVGSALEELVDVRVIAATNRDCLEPECSPLREDLFHRLSAIVIQLPALRQRPSDIPLLVQHFLSEAQAEHGPRVVSAKTMRQLSSHAWKGNIRELRNSVFRALALGAGTLQLCDFLPQGITRPVQPHLSLIHISEPTRLC